MNDADAQNQILIDPLSARSLQLELYVNDQLLGSATGFPVESNDEYCLITNWHVVAGRNPDTGELLSDTGALPDEVRVAHHERGSLGSWVIRSEALHDSEGNPRWIEHPAGRLVDVVALPIVDIDDEVDVHPLDLSLAEVDMLPQVAMPVSIIGYPYGLATAGRWPIWKTGHIASDPDLDYDGRPAFLIDATTRGGMSGSPVVLRLTGGYPTRDGGFVLAGGTRTRFLGVYSGRIHEHAEVGRVWRPRVIREILGTVPSGDA